MKKEYYKTHGNYIGEILANCIMTQAEYKANRINWEPTKQQARIILALTPIIINKIIKYEL